MRRVKAPPTTHRLIPSRYPPIGLFDSVATAADLAEVMELAGWTNDRLVAERVGRLPRSEWVFGRPNASVVMAAFLHVVPGGSRFNGPELGAWYAAAELATSVAEVGHHLRREALARGAGELSRVYRCYEAQLPGDHVDVASRGESAALLAPDSYVESQKFGEALRARGEDGVSYPSVRHAAGTAFCAYRPSKVVEVVQAAHYEVTVEAGARQIVATALKS